MKSKITLLIFIVFMSGCTLAKKCSDLENEIKILIKEKNYCNKNSDCAYLSDFIKLDCPFGCYNLVNKSENFSEIKNLSKSYFADCKKCFYGCPVQVKPNKIICENNKCTKKIAN